MSILGVSNTFTGPATTLEIYGDFCAAYSGIFGVDNNETTMLEFTTGNFISVMKVQFNYPTSDGDNFKYTVYLNETAVQSYVIDHSALYGYQNSVIYIVVPAYTIVKCTALNQGSSSSRDQVCSITGRLYRD